MKNIGFAVCIITAITLPSCGIVKNNPSNADDVYTIGGDFKHIQNDQVAREQKAILREQEKQTAIAALYKTNISQSTTAATPTAAISSQNSPCNCNNMYPGYGTYGFNTGYNYGNNYSMMGYGYNTSSYGYMGNNYHSPYYGYNNSYGYNNYYTPQNYSYNTYSNNSGGYTENTQQHTTPQHRGTGIGSSTPGNSSGVNASFDKPQVAAQTNTPPTVNVQVHTRSTYNNPQTSYTPVPQYAQPAPQTYNSTSPATQQGYTPVPVAAQQSYTPTPQATYQSYAPAPQPVYTQPTYHQPTYSTPTPSYSAPSYSTPTPRSGVGGFGGNSSGGGSIGVGSHSSGGGGRHR